MSKCWGWRSFNIELFADKNQFNSLQFPTWSTFQNSINFDSKLSTDVYTSYLPSTSKNSSGSRSLKSTSVFASHDLEVFLSSIVILGSVHKGASVFNIFQEVSSSSVLLTSWPSSKNLASLFVPLLIDFLSSFYWFYFYFYLLSFVEPRPFLM